MPRESDADAFWSTLEDYYLRLITALAASPQLAALVRGWIAAASIPAQQQLEQAMLPWMERALVAASPRRGQASVGLGQTLSVGTVSLTD